MAVDTVKLRESLVKSMTIANESATSELEFSKDYRGIVRSINGSKCIVEINGVDSECNIIAGSILDIGDVVNIFAFNNNYSDKYTFGRTGFVNEVGGDGTNLPSHNHDNRYYTKTEIDKQHKKLKALSLIL